MPAYCSVLADAAECSAPGAASRARLNSLDTRLPPFPRPALHGLLYARSRPGMAPGRAGVFDVTGAGRLNSDCVLQMMLQIIAAAHRCSRS